MSVVSAKNQKKLMDWFEENQRIFPWRNEKDPYLIWISEVMLQQTRSETVIPYYKKFIKKFPNLKTLSQAKEEDVFSLWAGLGYYQRARNLLKAAKRIREKKIFPKTYKALLDFPGFGDYTSRAVSSIAFGENAGVLDGNVIRFLSRYYNLAIPWWKSIAKKKLQILSDAWVRNVNSAKMNPALMELGSLICIQKNPLCSLCPLHSSCKALKQNTQTILPLKKKKVKSQMWLWQADLVQKGIFFILMKNENLPFLKNRVMFLGKSKKIEKIPRVYDFIHYITNYKIYVKVNKKKFSQEMEKNLAKKNYSLLTRKKIKEKNPSSLLRKILEHCSN